MSYLYRSGGKTRTSSGTNRYGRGRSKYNKHSQNSDKNQYIDPKRFVQAATVTEADEYKPNRTFADFTFTQSLQKNLVAKGYIAPSPIQNQTIPEALKGRDIIGIASTGTGKTAAFALPVLQRLISEDSSAALIIAPTRELAQQIQSECKDLAVGSSIYSTLLIGGSSMGRQLSELRHRPRMIVGTPGRIKDHLVRGTLKLHNFNMVVLDEVDRMLDMGFVHDVKKILSYVNKERQSFYFSATIDYRVRSLIETFTKDPFVASIKAGSTSENVHQDVVRYQTSSDKIDKLHSILLKDEVAKVLVFDETQRSVERLNKELIDRGFLAESIHGGKTQGKRKSAMARFKNNEINILVATDVAARGIDVSDISHVINFSVPKVYDDYIHRIGRTGRAGQIGHALTFVPH